MKINKEKLNRVKYKPCLASAHPLMFCICCLSEPWPITMICFRVYSVEKAWRLVRFSNNKHQRGQAPPLCCSYTDIRGRNSSHVDRPKCSVATTQAAVELRATRTAHSWIQQVQACRWQSHSGKSWSRLYQYIQCMYREPGVGFNCHRYWLDKDKFSQGPGMNEGTFFNLLSLSRLNGLNTFCSLIAEWRQTLLLGNTADLISAYGSWWAKTHVPNLDSKQAHC